MVEEISPKEGEGVEPYDKEAIESAEELQEVEKTTNEEIAKADSERTSKVMSELYTKQLDTVKNDIKNNVDDPEEAEKLGKFMDNLKTKLENTKDAQGKPDYQEVLKSLFDDGTEKFAANDLYDGLDTAADKEKANSALNKYLKNYKGRSVAAIKDVFPDFMDKLTTDSTIGTVIDEGNFTADESVSRQKAAQDLAEEQVTEDAEERFNNNAADRAARELEEGKTPNTSGRFIDPKTLLKLLSLLLSIGSLGIFAWWTIISAMNLSGCKEISCTKEQKFPTAKPVKCYQGSNPNVFAPNDKNTINFTSAACQCDPPDGVTEDNYKTKLKGCSSDTCNSDDLSVKDNLRPYGPECERAGKFCKGDGVSCPFYSYSYSITSPFSAIGNTYNGAMNGFNTEANAIWDLIKKIGIYALIAIGILLGIYIIYKLINHYLPNGEKTNTNTNFGNIDRSTNYFLRGMCNTVDTIKPLKTRTVMYGKFALI